MNRDTFWVSVAVAGTLGATYLNEKFNLANPELERKLVGCWGGATPDAPALTGEFVLQVHADGTFRETGIERLTQDPKFTKIVNASGTWKVQKDRWILDYDESNANFSLPRARQSLKLVVLEVNDEGIRARGDYSISLPYELARVPSRSGLCQVQA
jgi:hypothetical protein